MEFSNQGIHIYDVSYYQTVMLDQNGRLLPSGQQKHIDFHTMKLNGASAVVVRAGQHNWKDVAFDISWRNAEIAGLPRSSYFFCDKDGDPKQQARFYWDIMKNDPPEGFLAGDLETGSWPDFNSWYVFFNELQQYSGFPKIFLYTNLSFWTNPYGPKTDAEQRWFSDRFELWIANYRYAPQGVELFGKWNKATLWQDGTWLSTNLGVWSKEIDHNWLNGGKDEFERIFGKQTAPETPEEPPVIIVTPEVPVTGNKYKCTASSGLYVRVQPNTMNNPLGALKSNEVVDEVSTNADKSWIKIKTASGLVGWCHSAYLLKTVNIDPPAPPVNESDGYWFVLHDWQKPPDYKLRNIHTLSGGTPEVFRAGDIENYANLREQKLNRELQYFWLDLNSLNVFGRTHGQLNSKEYKWLVSKWSALGSNYRAYTNKHGLDKFCNYPSNSRLGKPLPVLYSLLAGGASLKGTVVKNSKGVEMVKIHHFDPNNLPDIRSINLRTDPRIMFATNISGKKVVGGYRVTKFPMFSEPNRGIYRDAIVPIISTRDIYYPKAFLKWVPGNVKSSPYCP